MSTFPNPGKSAHIQLIKDLHQFENVNSTCRQKCVISLKCSSGFCILCQLRKKELQCCVITFRGCYLFQNVVTMHKTMADECSYNLVLSMVLIGMILHSSLKKAKLSNVKACISSGDGFNLCKPTHLTY